MEVLETRIREVKLLKPRVFGDARGFFLETWRDAMLGPDVHFVQDNHSRSLRGTLRGLHYQLRTPQGKLVRVTRGAVFDVAVDLRRSSPTFGAWVGAELSDSNFHMLWVPPGFAHGFLTLSESADFVYKCTEFYSAPDDRAIAWNDAEIGVEWPLPRGLQPLLSERDGRAPAFREAETFA
jgi:dTDP-4-dehydrorhamnose 3,5-epimerase